MEKEFNNDYYRMTGKQLKKSLITCGEIMLKHNLRYMFWWRLMKQNRYKFLARINLFLCSRKYGLEIGDAEIGTGLYLGHPYNITVSKDAVLGKNVNLHKGCTIGGENRGKRRGAPCLGDNIYVGINSTIVGKINIGNDVMIAPNTFINFDVPSHSIVIGNPGKIIAKGNAVEGYVNYRV